MVALQYRSIQQHLCEGQENCLILMHDSAKLQVNRKTHSSELMHNYTHFVLFSNQNIKVFHIILIEYSYINVINTAFL